MMAKRKDPKASKLPDERYTTQITFRLPKAWLRRADVLAKRLSYPGHLLSRTDTFRAAVATGFEALERQAGPASRPKNGTKKKAA